MTMNRRHACSALVSLLPLGAAAQQGDFPTKPITVLAPFAAGGTVDIVADGLKVQIDFPRTTPYIGIGWGHQTGSGLRFSADIGASIGRATVTATPRGALATQPDIQANVDKELAELRDGAAKLRAVPQLSIGLGYSF